MKKIACLLLIFIVLSFMNYNNAKTNTSYYDDIKTMNQLFD